MIYLDAYRMEGMTKRTVKLPLDDCRLLARVVATNCAYRVLRQPELARHDMVPMVDAEKGIVETYLTDAQLRGILDAARTDPHVAKWEALEEARDYLDYRWAHPYAVPNGRYKGVDLTKYPRNEQFVLARIRNGDPSLGRVLFLNGVTGMPGYWAYAGHRILKDPKSVPGDVLRMVSNVTYRDRFVFSPFDTTTLMEIQEAAADDPFQEMLDGIDSARLAAKEAWEENGSVPIQG